MHSKRNTVISETLLFKSSTMKKINNTFFVWLVLRSAWFCAVQESTQFDSGLFISKYLWTKSKHSPERCSSWHSTVDDSAKFWLSRIVLSPVTPVTCVHCTWRNFVPAILRQMFYKQIFIWDHNIQYSFEIFLGVYTKLKKTDI